MSEETTNVSKKRILKSLKYLVLTVAILIGATGVSNANPFTVEADVACDPLIDPKTTGTLDGVNVTASDDYDITGGGLGIDFGSVERDDEGFIHFGLNVTEPLLCDGITIDTDTIEVITVGDGTAVIDSFACDAEPLPCKPSHNTARVGIVFPSSTGAYSATFGFTYVP